MREECINYPKIEDMELPVIKFLNECNGEAKKKNISQFLIEEFDLNKEVLENNTTDSGESRWNLHVNKLREKLVKNHVIFDSKKKEVKSGTWKLRNIENNFYPQINEVIYPIIFFLTSCGGWATQEMIKDCIVELFSIEKDIQDWIYNIQKEMISREYIMDLQKDKPGIWELTTKGRIEFVKNQIAFHVYWEKLKEIYKDNENE